MDGKIAVIQAQLNNVCRYERLLHTRLTELEREYIEYRILEEQAALQNAAIHLQLTEDQLPLLH
jgi:hypothetical protein